MFSEAAHSGGARGNTPSSAGGADACCDTCCDACSSSNGGGGGKTAKAVIVVSLIHVQTAVNMSNEKNTWLFRLYRGLYPNPY